MMFLVERKKEPDGPFKLVDALFAKDEAEANEMARNNSLEGHTLRVRQMNESGAINVIRWLMGRPVAVKDEGWPHHG